MPKYRVKQGKKFGPGGRFTAGTILEMSEREAKPFADILEPTSDTALVGSTQQVVPHEDLQFENELEVEVPADLKLMPSTLPEPEDDTELQPDKPIFVPDEEESEPAPKPERKPSSKSTRKRSHEG